MLQISKADNGTKVGVVGGAIVPHAPQFLTLPKTEDHEQVARVRAAMQKIGDGFRALNPDLVIVIANGHGEHFSIDCVPPFMVYCGNHANGAGKHSGPWPTDGETGMELMRNLLDSGFDPAYTLDGDIGTSFTIPLEFCGYPREMPFLPIFVNAYCPPQPKPERCFEFGKALARSLALMGRRAVILASGGLSHYPATPMYPTPDLETDKIIFDRLKAGNLQHLLSFDETRLDKTGNIELRSALILAGALGPERTPDVAEFEPSWHHIYGVFGWTRPYEPEKYEPYYPAIATKHVDLARAIYAVATNKESCRAYIRDPRDFASRFKLDSTETEALAGLDENKLRENFSINPIIAFWAKIAVNNAKKEQQPAT